MKYGRKMTKNDKDDTFLRLKYGANYETEMFNRWLTQEDASFREKDKAMIVESLQQLAGITKTNGE